LRLREHPQERRDAPADRLVPRHGRSSWILEDRVLCEAAQILLHITSRERTLRSLHNLGGSLCHALVAHGLSHAGIVNECTSYQLGIWTHGCSAVLPIRGLSVTEQPDRREPDSLPAAPCGSRGRSPP